MSSIDGLSGISSLLTSQNTNAVNSQRGLGQADESRRAEMQEKFNQAAIAAGLNEDDVESMQADIEAALESASTNSSGSTDAKSVIDGVLEKYGVDLTEFSSQMKSMGGPGGAGGPPPGGPPPGGASGTDFQSAFKDAAVASGLSEDEAESVQDEINAAIDTVLENSEEGSDTRKSIQEAIDSVLTSHGVDLDAFKTQLQATVGGNSSETIPLIDTQA